MFKSVVDLKSVGFNSASSSNFLDLYSNSLHAKVLETESRVPSRTFAPSTLRCPRISWFRIRGTTPEIEQSVDTTLNFTAQVGTSCHQNIQTLLIDALGDDWISVETYFEKFPPKFEYSCIHNGLETQVIVEEPPVKFAPDGIVYFDGKYRLLEIKTSDYNSFDKLTTVKPQHMDQIRCYCALLGLDSALVLYQDRVYGNTKCFELNITSSEIAQIWDTFSMVKHCVESNIPPKGLPFGDSWCTPAHCRYFKVCKEWG